MDIYLNLFYREQNISYSFLILHFWLLNYEMLFMILTAISCILIEEIYLIICNLCYLFFYVDGLIAKAFLPIPQQG